MRNNITIATLIIRNKYYKSDKFKKIYFKGLFI